MKLYYIFLVITLMTIFGNGQSIKTSSVKTIPQSYLQTTTKLPNGMDFIFREYEINREYNMRSQAWNCQAYGGDTLYYRVGDKYDLEATDFYCAEHIDDTIKVINVDNGKIICVAENKDDNNSCYDIIRLKYSKAINELISGTKKPLKTTISTKTVPTISTKTIPTITNDSKSIPKTEEVGNLKENKIQNKNLKKKKCYNKIKAEYYIKENPVQPLTTTTFITKSIPISTSNTVNTKTIPISTSTIITTKTVPITISSIAGTKSIPEITTSIFSIETISTTENVGYYSEYEEGIIRERAKICHSYGSDIMYYFRIGSLLTDFEVYCGQHINDTINIVDINGYVYCVIEKEDLTDECFCNLYSSYKLDINKYDFGNVSTIVSTKTTAPPKTMDKLYNYKQQSRSAASNSRNIHINEYKNACKLLGATKIYYSIPNSYSKDVVSVHCGKEIGDTLELMDINGNSVCIGENNEEINDCINKIKFVNFKEDDLISIPPKKISNISL